MEHRSPDAHPSGPHSLADQLLKFQTMGDSLREFVERVVPDLQRRGLFRKQYEGATLREHLVLKRPSNRYVAPSGA
jgi:hypothetical protein